MSPKFDECALGTRQSKQGGKYPESGMVGGRTNGWPRLKSQVTRSPSELIKLKQYLTVTERIERKRKSTLTSRWLADGNTGDRTADGESLLGG